MCQCPQAGRLLYMSCEATAWHFHTDARATARARMSVQNNVGTPHVAGYRP